MWPSSVSLQHIKVRLDLNVLAADGVDCGSEVIKSHFLACSRLKVHHTPPPESLKPLFLFGFVLQTCWIAL